MRKSPHHPFLYPNTAEFWAKVYEEGRFIDLAQKDFEYWLWANRDRYTKYAKTR